MVFPERRLRPYKRPSASKIISAALAAHVLLSLAFVTLTAPPARSTTPRRLVGRGSSAGDVAESGTASGEVDGGEATKAADEAAPEKLDNEPLFQELIVLNRTTPKTIVGAMVAIFSRSERAVDLVLVDPRSKHLLLYSVLQLPQQFRASAQVLLRRRDRRLRVRVIQHYMPESDEDAEVLRVSRGTNSTNLGNAISKRLVTSMGSNLKRSVKLEFAGPDATSKALLAIEHAGHLANRELTWMARYVQRNKEGNTDASSQGSQQVSILVTLIAT